MPSVLQIMQGVQLSCVELLGTDVWAMQLAAPALPVHSDCVCGKAALDGSSFNNSSNAGD